MITMGVNSANVGENEKFALTHWLYSMIVYYSLQLICIITVRIRCHLMLRVRFSFSSILAILDFCQQCMIRLHVMIDLSGGFLLVRFSFFFLLLLFLRLHTG